MADVARPGLLYVLYNGRYERHRHTMLDTKRAAELAPTMRPT